MLFYQPDSKLRPTIQLPQRTDRDQMAVLQAHSGRFRVLAAPPSAATGFRKARALDLNQVPGPPYVLPKRKKWNFHAEGQALGRDGAYYRSRAVQVALTTVFCWLILLATLAAPTSASLIADFVQPSPCPTSYLETAVSPCQTCADLGDSHALSVHGSHCIQSGGCTLCGLCPVISKPSVSADATHTPSTVTLPLGGELIPELRPPRLFREI